MDNEGTTGRTVFIMETVVMVTVVRLADVDVDDVTPVKGGSGSTS